MTAELEGLIAFGRLLRERGLPVGTGRILSFCRAATVLEPASKNDLYWAARATLVSSKEHLDVFDAIFESFFDSSSSQKMQGAPGEPPTANPSRVDAETLGEIEVAAGASARSDEEHETGGKMGVGIVASEAEVLRTKSFEDLSDQERAQTTALIRRLAVDIRHRRTRRLRSSSKGDYFDLRRTLRYSLRTQGEPFRRAWRQRRTRRRPLVLILDVSGSMAPYSRALLQFGFAAMAAGHKVEVFCFGTRLTRVSKALRTKDPNRALKDIAATVHDWEGGTRIGDSFRELIKGYGQRDFIRGAVVVVCSDGLERGDPEVLTAEMPRLARLVYRIVWVNPLKGSPLYEPLARGMAAALPHVDRFLPGHNVASLQELGSVLAE